MSIHIVEELASKVEIVTQKQFKNDLYRIIGLQRDKPHHRFVVMTDYSPDISYTRLQLGHRDPQFVEEGGLAFDWYYRIKVAYCLELDTMFINTGEEEHIGADQSDVVINIGLHIMRMMCAVTENTGPFKEN